MATIKGIDESIGFNLLLERAFRSSKWEAQRNAHDHTMNLSFRCRARGHITIPEEVLYIGDLSNRYDRFMDHVYELYNGTHSVKPQTDREPMFECMNCGSYRPAVVITDDFEFAERQGTLWMQHAEALRKAQR